MIDEKKEEIIVTPNNNINDSKKSLRIVTIIGAVVGIILLLIFKKLNPNFSLGYLILISFGLILLATGIYYFSDLKKLLIKKEKENTDSIPPPVSKEILLEKLHKEALTNKEYFNHVKKINETTQYNIGENLIYCFDVEVLYNEPNESSRYVILYNANYPDKLPAILHNPNHVKIKIVANSLSSKPQQNPEVRKEEFFNPATGFFHKKEESIPNKKKKKEEKKEELE